MAITKTKTVQNISIYEPAEPTAAASTNAGNKSIVVTYQFKFTDSSDSDLPLISHSAKNLFRYDADGNATDISGEDSFVQSICNSAWS
jgi:hypothetical protein